MDGISYKDELEQDVRITSDEEYERDGLISNARNGFIRKVYSLLAIQLAFTTFMVVLTLAYPAFREFQQANWGLYILAAIISIASMIALVCCQGMSKQTPQNYIMLSVFTAAESYMVSMLCSFYETESVVLAAVTTLAATVGLTLYAATTKSDFTECTHYFYGFFWSFFLLVITASLVNSFFLHASWLHTLFCIGFAAIFSIYLIIDTQLILGGRHKELTLDNYVLGAILLYIDIIRLFINILQIIGKARD